MVSLLKGRRACYRSITALRLLIHSFVLSALVAGHDDAGLHGLSGDNPVGDPMPLMPEIQGAFQVKCNVRINEISATYHAIFHWITDELASPASSILFAYGSQGFQLEVQDDINGNLDCLDSSLPMVPGSDLYNLEFSMDGTSARIVLSGFEIVNCPSTVVPSNVTRVHYLGESPKSGSNPALEDWKGAVLGIMVVNTDNPSHPRDRFRFWNIASQVLQPVGFSASFYARFDSLSEGLWQRIFDFSNGSNNDNIFCGQISDTDGLRCRVFHGPGGTPDTTVDAPGVLEVKEWAFWHFLAEFDGLHRFYIMKNGEVVSKLIGIEGFPRGLFRTMNSFGKANFFQEKRLHGVVVGFRLDTRITT